MAIKQGMDALWLLKWGAPTHYAEALPQLKKTTVIKLPTLEESGGSSFTGLGYEIYILLSYKTREAGTVWLASTFAHEACHVRQYTAGSDVWPPQILPYIAPPQTGNEEKECETVSYDVLKLLGADQSVLDYVKSYLDK